MQYFDIRAGSTSVILPISVFDSSSTVGAKLAGLVFNTASLTCYYNRMGATGAATAVSLVTATKGTFTSSGFVAVDGTNMPGDYELHIPNAALAAGVTSVLIHLKGAADMVPVDLHVKINPSVAQTGDSFARIGAAGAGLTNIGTIATVTNLTNLPTIPANWLTAAGIATGAITSGKFAASAINAAAIASNAFTAVKFAAGSLDGKGNWNIGKTGYALTTADWNVGKTGYSLTVTPPTAATIADATWDELLAGHAISGSAGEALDAAGTAGDPWVTALPGAYGAGTAGQIVGDNINATVSSRMAEASINTTAGAVDSVTLVATTTTNTDMRGTDSAGTAAELAKVPKSDGTSSWNATALGAINAEADTAITDAALATAANLATVDGNVDAVKAKTDSLTFTVANQVDSNAQYWNDTVISTAIQTAADVRAEMDSNSTKLATLSGGIIEGATTGTPTTTSTNTDLTGFLDGELVGRVIVFTGGTADGQAATILTYTATSGVVTFAALTTAPAASDSFKII